MNSKKRLFLGQATIEYAVLIACVIGALVAMQIYLKRTIQGRVRKNADEIGRQYDPQNTVSDMHYRMRSNVTSTTEMTEGADGKVQTATTVTTNGSTERTWGSETVRGF
jgi:Flp pilus assembly pilin Flp